ncbi:EF-hand superfamily Ca2+-modulated protein [Penicillium brasilianum]|uniref:EF-hand superfamily Ca2+-modulated protein n=1 Tax=Penicillium brasilianum TaxID=104259 RepID=A0A1S9RR66_PENBI|nr:EF-hand superfamily Ca2+-modulated protein [Penicillium brasilianum]
MRQPQAPGGSRQHHKTLRRPSTDFSSLSLGMTNSRPPKRRGAPASSSTTTTATPKRPRSKLAKENDITADEENEIKEVFQLFADANEDFPAEKDGVMPREDVRKAMVYLNTPSHHITDLHFPRRALGVPPSDSTELADILSAVDPTSTGYVAYSAFVTAVAAKLHSQDDDARVAEVDTAYQLFTRGSDGPISLSHLRRIARELKEDSIDDNLLKDMIIEANGGAGLSSGVTLEQFHDVMIRAGVFKM